jgi:hypothetical protein
VEVVGPPSRIDTLEGRADSARVAGTTREEEPTVDSSTRWIGIDLHRLRSQIAVIDEHGEPCLSKRIINDRETFLELLGDRALWSSSASEDSGICPGFGGTSRSPPGCPGSGHMSQVIGRS